MYLKRCPLQMAPELFGPPKATNTFPGDLYTPYFLWLLTPEERYKVLDICVAHVKKRMWLYTPEKEMVISSRRICLKH